MRHTRWAVIAAAVIGTGCGVWHGSPVPVAGEIAGLQGSWEGAYSSVETGRSGTITFALQSGTDSATGDVVMTPAQVQDVRGPDAPQIAGPRVQLPQALRIMFVRAEGQRISGRLDVYQDPRTGERLLTTFEGRLYRNEFKGTYTTRTEATGHLSTGEWSVKRVKN